jgi:hypothetical protein
MLLLRDAYLKWATRGAGGADEEDYAPPVCGQMGRETAGAGLDVVWVSSNE